MKRCSDLDDFDDFDMSGETLSAAQSECQTESAQEESIRCFICNEDISYSIGCATPSPSHYGDGRGRAQFPRFLVSVPAGNEGKREENGDGVFCEEEHQDADCRANHGATCGEQEYESDGVTSGEQECESCGAACGKQEREGAKHCEAEIARSSQTVASNRSESQQRGIGAEGESVHSRTPCISSSHYSTPSSRRTTSTGRGRTPTSSPTSTPTTSAGWASASTRASSTPRERPATWWRATTGWLKRTSTRSPSAHPVSSPTAPRMSYPPCASGSSGSLRCRRCPQSRWCSRRTPVATPRGVWCVRWTCLMRTTVPALACSSFPCLIGGASPHLCPFMITSQACLWRMHPQA